VKRVIKSANLAIAEVEVVQRAQYNKLEDTVSMRIRQLRVKQWYSSKLDYCGKAKIICECHTDIPY